MHESLTLKPIFYRTNKIKPLALTIVPQCICQTAIIDFYRKNTTL